MSHWAQGRPKRVGFSNEQCLFQIWMAGLSLLIAWISLLCLTLHRVPAFQYQRHSLRRSSAFSIRRLWLRAPQHQHQVMPASLSSFPLASVAATEVSVNETIRWLQGAERSARDVEQRVSVIISDISQHSTADLNRFIGCLGKQCRHMLSIAIVQAMRRPNGQTMEFFTKSLVLDAREVHRAYSMKGLPKPTPEGVPEVLLLGRSNVGKSSLLNALLDRRQLASVNATPGHTQALHLYRLSVRQPTGNGSKPLVLVDAPGLGYAATVDEQVRLSWRTLLQRFMAVRRPCALVLLLVDVRHPLGAVDKGIMRMAAEAMKEREKVAQGGAIAAPFELVVVLTKADNRIHNAAMQNKVTERCQEVRDHWRQLRPSVNEDEKEELAVAVTSCRLHQGVQGQGIEQVWAHLLRLLVQN